MIDMDPNPASPKNADSQASARPVSTKERVGEIDVLRGWAIFGMLLVNTGSLGGYWMFPQRWTGMLDRVTIHLVAVLAEDKFFTMFAFLFGLGFCWACGPAANASSSISLHSCHSCARCSGGAWQSGLAGRWRVSPCDNGSTSGGRR